MSSEADLTTRRRYRWATALFGPADPRGRAPLPGWLWSAAGAAGAVIAFLRLSPENRGVFWAEDAAVFYQDALSRPWDALLLPYEGYYPGLPRWIAGAIVPWAPPESVPALFALAVAVVTAAVAVIIAWAVRQRVGGFAAPAIVWVTVVALPAGAGESLGNLANLHWYLMAGSVWVLLARWTRPWIAAGAVALVATTILSAGPWPLLLPLIGLRLWWRWGDHGRLLALAAGAASTLQAGLMAAAPALGAGRTESDTSSLPTLVELAQYYAWRVVAPAVTTPETVEGAADALPVWLVTVVALVGCAAVLALAWRQRTSLALAATLLAHSAAIFALLWSLSRFPLLWPTELTIVARYAVAPAILVVSALVVTAPVLRERLGSRLARAGGAIAVAWFVAMAIAGFSAWPVRDGSPTYADQLPAGRSICAEVEPGDQLVFSAAPEGWDFVVPCAAITTQVDSGL